LLVLLLTYLIRVTPTPPVGPAKYTEKSLKKQRLLHFYDNIQHSKPFSFFCWTSLVQLLLFTNCTAWYSL